MFSEFLCLVRCLAVLCPMFDRMPLLKRVLSAYVETVCALIWMDIVNAFVMSLGAQISPQGPVSVSWAAFRSRLLDHRVIVFLVLGWGCSIKSSIITVQFFPVLWRGHKESCCSLYIPITRYFRSQLCHHHTTDVAGVSEFDGECEVIIHCSSHLVLPGLALRTYTSCHVIKRLLGS